MTENLYEVGADVYRRRYNEEQVNTTWVTGFACGTEWADQHQPSQWVSLQDDVPNEGELVLVYSHRSKSKPNSGRVNVARFVRTPDGGYTFKKVSLPRTITHWAHIPQLPNN